MAWASGRHAIGICDICAFQYKLHQLRFNSYDLRVCPTCWDGQFDKKNHPQNFPPPVSPDPVAVWRPAPDVDLAIIGTIWDNGVTQWDQFYTEWVDQ